MLKKLFTIFLFLFALTSVYSQLSKIHYIPPVAGQNVSDHMIYISTPSTGYINVTIKPIGGTRTDWESRTIKNDEPWDFSTGTGRGDIIRNINDLNGVINNSGYIIESQGLTYVSFRFNSPLSSFGGGTPSNFHSGAYVSKGVSALGSRLRTATFTNSGSSGGGSGAAQHFISILATENNTKVTLSDFPAGIEFTNNDLSGAQTSPLDLPVLNKNETYILGFSPSHSQSRNVQEALIGALVQSEDDLGGTDTKPVVVVSGSIGGSLRDGSENNTDYGVDQITDINLLGSEYIFIKGYALDEIEKIILIADEDGTPIFKDGVNTGIVLDAGEHTIYRGGDYTNGSNMYISTYDPATTPTTVPKKLVAYQGIGFQGSTGSGANQGLVFVPPLSCSSRGNIDNIPLINRIGSNKMLGGTLTILTEDGAVLEIFRQEPGQPSVLIADNQGTSGVYDLTVDAKDVVGKPGYKTYFLLSQTNLVLEDNIAVKSDKELYLGSSTYSSYGSGGSFYSGFVTDPQVQPDLTISPLGICISSSGVSNVELQTSNSFDTYKWQIEDDSTIPSTWSDAPTNSANPLSTNDEANYNPIQEGSYRLVGTLSCYVGKEYISETQVVSICPTDFDGDGIVDNIDLDLDNDGISNLTESSGNFKFDFSTILSPVLLLPTPFTSTANYAGATTSTSTFTGDSDGNFKSEITAAGSNDTSTYTLDPIQLDTSISTDPQKLNILFTEDSSVTHTYNADESFSIQSFPSDKNFTVLDPGERLLVNNGSGFVTIPTDGYSGNKIIFKYNNDPVGPGEEFSFYAYDIEGFEFTHSISSVASADSSFNGKFEILDYILDTDADGDLDMYDWDSDDDGCNDVIESDVNYDNTTVKPRVNLDPNSDGIYGGLTYGTSGTDVIQYPDVDGRGRINDLIDVTSGTYLDPLSDPVTSNPLYLDNTAPAVIFNTQPVDIQICQDGDDATFTIDVDPGTGYTAYYQWVVDKGTGIYEILLDDPATTADTTAKDLIVLNVDSSMNGWKYSALIYSDGVLCQEQSDEAVLKVEAALPTAKAVDLADPLFDENWIIKCDDGTDQYDGISSFDLSLIDSYILDGQATTDFEVSYFLDPSDALDLSKTGITNPTTFTNTPDAAYDPASPTTQTLELHVRVRNINSNCIADPMSFELTINTVPLLVNLSDVEQCNDKVFDIEALQSTLSINAATEIFEFYNSAGTLIDPINGLDPTKYELPNPNTSNEETITVKVKNSSTLGSGCSQQTTFVIRLGACDIPATFPVLDEVLCETSTDPLGGSQDGFETFDNSIFSNIEADLIAAEPLFGIFGTDISFYRSDADATAGVSTAVIDKTADYTTSAGNGFSENISENRWEQELWVRVENTTFATPCFDIKQVATLYINKLPELLTATVDVNQCDVGIFNLTDQEDNFSSNYADEIFEYYDSSGTLIDPINGLDPANYTAAGLNEIITVTINTTPSIGAACVNTTASINLAWSVTTLPAAYTLIDEYLIETDPDPKGQGQDGVETFDKTIFATVQTDLIAAESNFAGKTFSFYRSQNDALTSNDKIDTTVDFATDPAKNGFTFNATENRWEQQIWVYIEDSVTTAIATCYGLYQIATLYVEKRPVFYDVVMQELCDAETPLDLYSLFDTSLLFSEFTTDPTATIIQDTSLFTVEYSYVDNKGATVTLDPTFPLSFDTTDQTITVTLTNNSTNSALTAGVSTGTIEFKVYEQPVAYPTDPSVAGVYTFEECDDLASGADDDLLTVFDMSTIKTDLLTDLSGTSVAQDPNNFDFEFSVAGAAIVLGTDYTATTGDQIEVTITNPLYPVCAETITIDFIVNELPSFDIDDTTVICLNPLPGQPVKIGTLNPKLPNYIYSWTYDKDPAFTGDLFYIEVDKGGVYTVIAQDPVTLCTREKSITVTESEMASIDFDKDGTVSESDYEHFIEVLDLTDDNTNTITINNVADLGIGDYEFSLDDSFGPYDPNPIFTDVPPGVHTLYIRDKNSYYTYDYGCGIAEVKISIIGYKKYFTPNGDGINEKWKILGIDFDFNKDSKVYIFDRYGKLLKQLDPLSEGWDGNYLGKPMPATDYWFRTYLEDGREFKGHFSLVRGN